MLLLLHTITSTLQGPIGDALSEMRKVSAAVNNFRQKIIWPLALINQTRSFVSATRAHYTGLMSQIEGLKNNSATLALPMQLESIVPRRPVGVHRSDSLDLHAGLPAGCAVWNCSAGTAQPHGHRRCDGHGFAKDFHGLRPNDSGDANSRRFSRTAGDDCGSRVGVYDHCPGPRRRSCDSGAAGENACRSTAPGSNETGAPECDAQAQRHNDTKSFQPDPASSSSSLRSSKMNRPTLSRLWKFLRNAVVAVCGLAIVVALLPTQGPQPAWA